MADPLHLTHEYFRAFIEQSFVVTAGAQALALMVTEVRMLAPPKRQTLGGTIIDATTARLPFSVIFRSEGEMGLRQGTYDMTSPDGKGAISVFLVPVGFEAGGVIYEAVFN